MLVLTTKEKETININNDIKIIISEIKNNQVKIAIDSPKHNLILRNKIYEKISQKNLQSMIKNKNQYQEILLKIK